MPAKLVVTELKKGSRISLLGSSGKELLGSVVFSEPRAKGATLRALKGLLGDVVVEDHTVRAGRVPLTRATPGAPGAAEAQAVGSTKRRVRQSADGSPSKAGPARGVASRRVSAEAPAKTAAALDGKSARTRTAKLGPRDGGSAPSGAATRPRARRSTSTGTTSTGTASA